jgi:hypothetical protein
VREAIGSAANAPAVIAAQRISPARRVRLLPADLVAKVKHPGTLCKEEMARSKEFDEGRDLAAAMDLFGRQGYENTSLEALMREMGIARQSLYDTFGDKRALYLKAMAFYRQQTNSSLRETLTSAPTVKRGSRGFCWGLSRSRGSSMRADAFS